MKRLALFAGVVGLGMLGLLPSPALAETNEQVQAANATHTAVARAQADLANAIAQGRITRTPTPTPVPPTLTPRPTATPEPDPPTASSTALPALLVPPTDSDPLAAYIRPSTTDQAWLELALPQGRWDFRFDTPACEPLAAWSNVWLAPGVVPPLLVVRDGTLDGAVCSVAQSAWHSDVPCAMTDGQCDVEADAAYWAALDVIAQPPVAEVQAADPASPEPTAIPRVVVLAPVSRPVPPAPVRLVQVVVQTVVVVVTAVPSDTPTPNPTASSTPLLVNTTPSPAPIPSPPAPATGPAATPVPALVRQGLPRPTLEVAGAQAAAANPVAELAPPAEAPGLVAWLVVGLGLCGAIAVAAVRSRLAADRRDRKLPVGSGASPAFVTAEQFDWRLAVGAAIAIILLSILILAPLFIGVMDR